MKTTATRRFTLARDICMKSSKKEHDICMHAPLPDLAPMVLFGSPKVCPVVEQYIAPPRAFKARPQNTPY
jgi:hypothetical protein